MLLCTLPLRSRQPTNSTWTVNMCQLSLKVLTCGSGGGAGGPGNGVRGGVVVKCGGAPCRGCGGPCGSCWGPCGYLSGVVSWWGGGGRGGPGLLKNHNLLSICNDNHQPFADDNHLCWVTRNGCELVIVGTCAGVSRRVLGLPSARREFHSQLPPCCCCCCWPWERLG